MLRIARGRPTADGREVLRLEGKVVGKWVGELRRACRETLGKPDGCLTLDLTEVTFIDGDGVELFRELSAARVRLTNTTPFANEQLRNLTGR